MGFAALNPSYDFAQPTATAAVQFFDGFRCAQPILRLSLALSPATALKGELKAAQKVHPGRGRQSGQIEA